MNIAVQKPGWRANYDIGYCGFSINHHSFISAGINWFQRWSDLPRVPSPTHCFIVTGEDEIIEAGPRGVQKNNLSSYLHKEDLALLIRRPAQYTPAKGQLIAECAAGYLGQKYGYTLIAALAVSNSTVGKILSLLTKGWFERQVTRLADAKRQQVCSELVARCLQSIPFLAIRGVLQRPARTIKPVDLFQDTIAFEPPEYAVELVP